MNSKLHKYHKKNTKSCWKKYGLLWISKEEFEEIYLRVISSTNCELCQKPYKSNRDRHMDHEHCIDNKWGWFRNVVCTRCNLLRSDRNQLNNTSGYIGIHKAWDKTMKQGFRWVFEVTLNGKQKTIKSSKNKEWLIEFADQWKIDNNYNT
tara:strand:- start:140 stop:589 length:450 start_codon:yes stop_codon:yes gene_type:complete